MRARARRRPSWPEPEKGVTALPSNRQARESPDWKRSALRQPSTDTRATGGGSEGGRVLAPRLESRAFWPLWPKLKWHVCRGKAVARIRSFRNLGHSSSRAGGGGGASQACNCHNQR